MNDAGEIPIVAVLCDRDGCPLMAMVATTPNRGPERCVFHATGKLNAIDQVHRKGMTANEVLRAVVRRRRMAADYAAIRRRVDGDLVVSMHEHGAAHYLAIRAGVHVVNRSSPTLDPERLLSTGLRMMFAAIVTT